MELVYLVMLGIMALIALLFVVSMEPVKIQSIAQELVLLVNLVLSVLIAILSRLMIASLAHLPSPLKGSVKVAIPVIGAIPVVNIFVLVLMSKIVMMV